jgi:hypothetical protein
MLNACALVAAVIAALRGTWSPCGLSMLTQLNPVAERGRGNRFAITACWYVAGAALGGALLGAVLAAGAGLVSLATGSVTALCAIGVTAAVVALYSDLPRVPWQLPLHPRQVNDRWLTSYRRWIYAGGFGVQIGTGFATYVMSATVYLVAALAVLTGDPQAAWSVGLVFGVVRGTTVLLAARCRTPEVLRDTVRRVEQFEPASRIACLAVDVVAATLLAATVGFEVAGTRIAVIAALVAASVLAVLALWGTRTAVQSPQPQPRDRLAA